MFLVAVDRLKLLFSQGLNVLEVTEETSDVDLPYFILLIPVISVNTIL